MDLIQTHYLQAHKDMRAKKQNKFIRRLYVLLQYKCRCFLAVWSLLAHHESFHGRLCHHLILIAATNWSVFGYHCSSASVLIGKRYTSSVTLAFGDSFMSSLSFQLGGKLDL